MKLTKSLLNDRHEKWRQFCAALENENFPVPDGEQADLLKKAFVFSDFAFKNMERFPQMAKKLIKSGDLFRSYKPGEYHKRLENALKHIENETELMSALRKTRRYEMTRIACRDLGKKAGLFETMSDLSAFADACLHHALLSLEKWHMEKYGAPAASDGSLQKLVIIGMGKLGAKELNFSSDIDLIFLYPDSGNTKGKKTGITNHDFFTKLCRSLIRVIGSNTHEGMVFRVDTNLRPYGESGPLVMSFDMAESYYHEQGREWERYAWIKARAVAGDTVSGEKFLKSLNSFVYRRYLDYGVFESLREMKEKISLEVRRRGMKDNIKLGPGGIREIEFFGQIFQLIRGGVIPALQERGILKVLETLLTEKFINTKVKNELEKAYVFLRNTEHRLQEYSDSQTHVLPKDSKEKERLALSMEFDSWENFYTGLKNNMANVHAHFNRLLKSEKSKDKKDAGFTSLWENPEDDRENRKIILRAGYKNAGSTISNLKIFKSALEGSKSISTQGTERISRLMPVLIEKAGLAQRPDIALDRILALIKSIKRRTSYISLLLENPDTLLHLVKLADMSAWIINFLTRHPVLLDELIDHRTLYTPPERQELEEDMERRMARIDPDDLEYIMDELRIFKQVNVLRVAAADISDAMPLMRVSDHLSHIAEVALETITKLAWDYLVKKHGVPKCDHELLPEEMGFVVIAYGKLGGIELGYGSDLDLVFLHSGASGPTDGEKPIDTTTFYARMGQRILHMLTTHTATGKLYEADMRLRPSGSSGILVCHMDGFGSYQMNEAWTWEKQALIRARPVAGDKSLRKKFNNIRAEVLGQKRDAGNLKQDITNMRMTMKKELLKHEPGIFDLKQGPGGMVDIEFLVQYLVLKNAFDYPGLLKWTDNVRLIACLQKYGIIDETCAYFLRKAYLCYRSAGHKLSLREKPAKISENHFALLRNEVMKYRNMHFGGTETG